MRVNDLIKILQACEPEAEVIVGSHTLPHSGCTSPIGVWPAFGVEVGEFVHGGPLGQNKWVKTVASDVWGLSLSLWALNHLAQQRT